MRDTIVTIADKFDGCGSTHRWFLRRDGHRLQHAYPCLPELRVRTDVLAPNPTGGLWGGSLEDGLQQLCVAATFPNTLRQKACI